MELKITFLKKIIGLLGLQTLFVFGLNARNLSFKERDPIKLFTLDRAQELNWRALRSNKAVRIFNYDQSQYQALKSERPAKLDMVIPTLDGDIEIELIANQVLTEDFVLSTDKQRNLYYNPGLYYKGVIKGKSNSVVAISLFDDDVMGVISEKGVGNLVMGTSNALRRNTFMLFNDGDIDQPEFKCNTEELPNWTEEIKPGALRSQVAVKCINVYFEVGNSVYTNKGSTTATANYISGIFNGTSSLYGAESITTSISEIHIWTSPEPHSSGVAFGSSLGSFNGNLAHYVRMAPGSSAAGEAYVPGICGSPFAFSELFPTYSYPSYSWSVNVVTHEMGHNLGSNHTQSCSWPGGAIDGCVAQEGSCVKGPIPGPGGGTIMSYCHQNSSVGINFSNGFGPFPGDKIRTTVNNASCVGTSCGSGTITTSGSGGGGGGSSTPSDLVTASVTITPNTIATVSQGFSVSFNISNAGGAAAASTGRVYFSNNNTLSADDPTVLNASIPALNTGVGVSGSFNTTLPSNTLPGVYYFIVCADATNTITESSESNNCNQASITLSNTLPTPQSFPDLVLAVSSNIPSVITAGQKIDINGSISNSGNATAGTSILSIVFSADGIFSSDDTKLHSSNVVILNPNGNSGFNTTVTLPSPLNTSNYFIIVCADENNTVIESSENNNCIAYAVTVAPVVVEKPKPDLTISALKTSLTTVPLGTAFTVSCTSTNNAQEAAGTFSNGIYLSKDNSFDGVDQLLKESSVVNGLTAGASSSTDALIEQKINPGNYFIIVCADHKGQVTESNEFNNCMATAITISNPIPDLIAESIVSSSEFLVNQTYPVKLRLKNIGNKKTETVTQGTLYLCNNNYIESNSILVGTIAIPLLEINSSKDSTFQFTPKDISEGSKFLIFCLDQANKINESDENNNCTSIPITITVPLPDLKALSNASLSKSIGKGTAFEFPFKASNIGSISSTSVSTEYYISFKPLLKSSGAFKLLIDTLEGLNPGDTLHKNVLLQLPSAATQGTYYLNICIDYNNKLKEISKVNNCQSIRFVIRQPLADLDVKSFGLHDPLGLVTEHSPFKVKLQIANGLEQVALRVGVKVRYSSKGSKDTLLVAKYIVDTLKPGFVKDTLLDVVIPEATQGKEFVFEVILDENQEITESDETNNKATFKFMAGQPLGDIDLQLLGIPDRLIHSGQELILNYRLINPGFAIVDTFEIISKITDSSSTHTLLTHRVALNRLKTQESDTITFKYSLPQSWISGLYKVSTIADLDNKLLELDETNNASTTDFQIIQSLPDLSIRTIKITDSLYKGAKFNANIFIKNLGTWKMPGTQDSILLSKDNKASADDLRIGLIKTPDLMPNDSTMQTALMLIPNDLKSGSYFLIVSVDKANQYHEMDETNNTKNVSLIIPNHKADLVHNGLRLSKPNISQGQNLDITQIIRNVGETATGKFEISYQLRGSVVHAKPTILLPNITHTKIIGEQGSVEIHTKVLISDSIPAGIYYLLTCLDAKNEIDEMSRENNCGQILIEVTNKSSLTTALNKPMIFSKITMYPNPTIKLLSIEGTLLNQSEPINLSILDYTGRRMLKDQFKSTLSLYHQIDVSPLASGVYIIELTSKHGTWKQPFVKL